MNTLLYAAHEIKNCAALILANVGLIKLADGKEEILKYCEGIARSVTRINDFAMETLAGGAEESATSDTQAESESPACDVIKVLTETAGEYRAAFPGMAFDLKIPDGSLFVNGREEQIRMIFSNILKNAAEACGPDGEITVRIEKEDKAVAVLIRDNGCGLSGALLEKFRREKTCDTAAFSGSSSKPGGSGFGLFACRETARKLGGEFEIYNSPPGGCEAAVRLAPREPVLKTGITSPIISNG